MKFRKKPVVIDAVQLPQHGGAFSPTCQWALEAMRTGEVSDELDILGYPAWVVRTLEDGRYGEAKHVGSPGDWLIRGVKGELYFCKPDIFNATYEPVS